MESSEITEHLKHKLKILEEIKVNTEKQCRFARRGELRGFRRLLNERTTLINELLRLNRELAVDLSRSCPPGSEKLLADIAATKREILECWARARQEALAARDRVGARLFGVRAGRQLQHQYVNRWVIPPQGARFNKQG